MPQWSDSPPAAGDNPSFRIIRTPAEATVSAIVTCLDLVGCPTHFVHNRTVPCEGTEVCKHCEAGHSWRWHGYLSAVLTQTHEHVLFEFTAPAADTFRNYITAAGQIRGCHFTARRPTKRPNGRVLINCKSTDQARIRLPAPPDVKKLLCRIWNIQATTTEEKSSSRLPIKNATPDKQNGDGRYSSEENPEDRTRHDSRRKPTV